MCFGFPLGRIYGLGCRSQGHSSPGTHIRGWWLAWTLDPFSEAPIVAKLSGELRPAKQISCRLRSPEPHRSPEEPRMPHQMNPDILLRLCSVSPDMDVPVLGPNGRAHSGDPMPQPLPVVGAVCVLQVWGLPEIIRASPICLGAIELACRVQSRARDPSGEMLTLLWPPTNPWGLP